MKKEVMTFRVTDDERKIIEKKAEECGLKPSQYIRMKLNFYNLGNMNNNAENNIMTPQAICDVLTEVQKIRQLYPEIDLDDLEGSVAALCHSQNS